MSRIAAAAILCAVVATPVDASPLTVPAGTPLVLNYDFTGSTPPPPYSSMDFSFDFDNYSGQPLTLAFYSELNAGGIARITFGNSGSASSFTFAGSFSGFLFDDLLDGILSVAVLSPVGYPSPLLISAPLTASVDGIGSVTLDAVAPTAVPEPASIILLGSGVMGMLARRRRQRSA